MVTRGMVQEITEIFDREDLGKEATDGFARGITQAIGIKELYPYYLARKNGSSVVEQRLALETGMEQTKQRTRKYAMKQRKWVSKLSDNGKAEMYKLDSRSLDRWQEDMEDDGIVFDVTYDGSALPITLPLHGNVLDLKNQLEMFTGSEEDDDDQDHYHSTSRYATNFFPNNSFSNNISPAAFTDFLDQLSYPTFASDFLNNFSMIVPESFSGTYKEAMAHAKRSGKLLLTYLHSPESEQAHSFCWDILQSEEIYEFIKFNYVFWVGMITPEAQAFLFNLIQFESYPIVSVVANFGGTPTILELLQGISDKEEFYNKIVHQITANERELTRIMAEEEEKESQRRIVEEQDQAYEESLKADIEKAKKEEEERQRQEAEIQRVEDVKVERLSRMSLVPPEPPKGPESTQVIFKLPDDSKLERRFNSTDTLQTLSYFLDGSGVDFEHYQIITQYPKKSVGQTQHAVSSQAVAHLCLLTLVSLAFFCEYIFDLFVRLALHQKPHRARKDMSTTTSTSDLVDRTKDLTTSDYYFDSYSHFGIHEEMLKDEVRTLSYKKAILNNRHLFKDKVVLDVGCGTGILCMFAAQAGAKLVIGVDNSEILPIAQKIIKANNFEDKIVLLKGKMEEVKLPVEKVDIIISEWMGYFMLYEGMLDTVLFARDKYLVPGGIIMPDKASLHITAIEDSDYKQDKIEYWNCVYGFDMSCIRELALTEPLVDVVQSKMIVTTDCSILNIDIHTIKKEELPFKSQFKLKAMRDDCIHAFVVYFDIEFSKGNKSVFFSTGPRAKYTHWKQSILYIEDVLKINRGEEVNGTIDVAPFQPNQRDLKIKLDYTFEGSQMNSNSKVDTNDQHDPELFQLTIEAPSEHWTWDRPLKETCHFSNQRDFNKQPMNFQFNGKTDPLCDIPCVGHAAYVDASTGFRGGSDQCTKSVYFTMENAPTDMKYDIYATIRLDSDVPLPMFGRDQYTYSEEPRAKDSVKQGLVSAFISNCGPTKRLEWMRRLQAAGVQVDSYGACQKNKELVPRGEATDYNGIKLDISRSYKFNMAFENSNAHDYVTEKLFGPLAIGTVPIYDGPENQKEFGPSNRSVIYASDFSSPEELAKYLLYLDANDDEYQKYFEWKKTGPSRDWTSMVDIANIGCECRVCIIAADRQRKQVGMNFGDADHRSRYIKVPKDWNESKGIVIYVRERGTYWFYSVAVPFETTYDELKTIIVDNVPNDGEFYSLRDIDSKQILMSDKLESSAFNLVQEQELEVVFVNMDLYFNPIPKQQGH
eukprot:gene3462-3937_t